jgi:hypothetical protein
MADDWRVTVSLGDEAGHALGAALHEHELEEQAAKSLGGPVAVSADSTHVFLYASTRTAAEAARRVVESILEREGGTARFALDRWHPLEEAWEPADVPLPVTEAERLRERERLEEQEAAETRAAGYAGWEVRLDLPSHRAAVELAGRLEAEGLRATRRWKYLLIGASDSAEARALAERLRREAPDGTEVQIQPGGEMAWEVAPRRPLVLFVLPG